MCTCAGANFFVLKIPNIPLMILYHFNACFNWTIFSECIKINDQINGNLFLGFSAWKWLYWKFGINDLPLFVQSNPTAFYVLLFRPHITNVCFLLLNFVLQTASFTCFDHSSSYYTSSAFVNVAISSKKVWKI